MLGAVLTAVLLLATIASSIVAGRMSTLAGRMSDLARNEAKSASDERAAHQLAVGAQKREAEERAKAETAERSARAAEEAGRKLLYTTDMQLVPFIWNDPQAPLVQLRDRLDAHVPGLDKNPSHKDDLRGFEWYYYRHLMADSSVVLSGAAVTVIDAAFTGDGRLVTLDQSRQVRLWDLDSRDEDEVGRRDLSTGARAKLTKPALSEQIRILSSNGRLAAIAVGNNVQVFDTFTGKETSSIDSVDDPNRRLIFSRDGDRLVIVDGKIRWCNSENGEVIASANKKFDRVNSLALSADGLTLAVVGHAAMGDLFSIYRLDATARSVTPQATDIGLRGTIFPSALSPDGQLIAVGTYGSGLVSIVDTATGRSITTPLSAHASPIWTIAFSGDGAKLATADSDGTIKIWADAQKLTSKSTALRTLKGHEGGINSAGFSRDGKRLVTTSEDNTARVWDLENSGAAIRPLWTVPGPASWQASRPMGT